MKWIKREKYDLPEGFDDALFPAYKQAWRRRKANVVFRKGVTRHTKGKTTYETHEEGLCVPYWELPMRTQQFIDSGY